MLTAVVCAVDAGSGIMAAESMFTAWLEPVNPGRFCRVNNAANLMPQNIQSLFIWQPKLNSFDISMYSCSWKKGLPRLERTKEGKEGTEGYSVASQSDGGQGRLVLDLDWEGAPGT